MLRPPRPANEAERLAALQALNILDTASEERFDRITRLAKRLFGVPIALVSLADDDRQWFKSRQGLDATETPREISFCGHAILGREVMVVQNAEKDERFTDNPLVVLDPGIRFYADCPLITENGNAVGTLCLIDRSPRDPTEEDLSLLRDLAALVEDELLAFRMASTDSLTGLSNRRGFEIVAAHAFAMCAREGRLTVLAVFDLDRFKPINDTYGHSEGDRVLVDFADLLTGTFRNSDVVCRLGGDEFCVLLTSTAAEHTEDIMDRFERSLSAYNRQSSRPYRVSCSIGTVVYSAERHKDMQSMFDDADARMYRQKREREASRQGG